MKPEISVVIPFWNAAATLSRCLDALTAQAGRDVEIILVDDHSSDNGPEIAARYPVKLIKLERQVGSAVARNLGAKASSGAILFFLDADVELAPGAFERARIAMADSRLDAMFGSYDDDPAERSTVSLFKNLAHHHFHQASGGSSTSFWTGCGLIRRDLFVALGGFDQAETGARDIELGYRLMLRHANVKLDPQLQVKHLKRWTLKNLLTTDFRVRAIPLASLWLKYGYLPKDLNFGISQRVALVMAIALVVTAPLSISRPELLWVVALCLAGAIWVNRDLYRLFLRRGGLRLTVGGFFLQQLYYLYGLAGIAVGVALHLLGGPDFVRRISKTMPS